MSQIVKTERLPSRTGPESVLRIEYDDGFTILLYGAIGLEDDKTALKAIAEHERARVEAE